MIRWRSSPSAWPVMKPAVRDDVDAGARGCEPAHRRSATSGCRLTQSGSSASSASTSSVAAIPSGIDAAQLADVDADLVGAPGVAADELEVGPINDRPNSPTPDVPRGPLHDPIRHVHLPRRTVTTRQTRTPVDGMPIAIRRR